MRASRQGPIRTVIAPTTMVADAPTSVLESPMRAAGLPPMRTVVDPDVIGPLPFHRMSRFPYPPGEKYPDDAEHRSYQRTYNTRVFPVPPAGPALSQSTSH